jgi:pimeloyl-ACP methyl ester carboxylesterase
MTRWVLLRGLTREAGHWGGFVEVLKARLGESQVLAIDLPGNGRLHREPSPTRVQHLLAHCRGQLRAMGAAPPYHLFAMSLGAMVAIEWADSHADELAGCVLVNTSLGGVSAPWQRLRPAALGTLLRLALGRADDRAWEAAILRLTARCVADPQATLGAWLALRRERPVSRANALRQLLAAARYRAPARRPAVPMLLLASRLDALVDVCCSRTLAGRWQLVLAEHPSAGHDLPLDDPQWTAARVAEWLPAIRRSTPSPDLRAGAPG